MNPLSGRVHAREGDQVDLWLEMIGNIPGSTNPRTTPIHFLLSARFQSRWVETKLQAK